MAVRKSFSFVFLLSAGLALAAASLWAGNIATVSNVRTLSGTLGAGATVDLAWDYTTADSFNDPRYVILVGDSCAAQAANAANQWVLSGDACASVPQGTNVNGNGCGTIPDNQTGPAITHTYDQTVTLPSTLTPGNTYYMVVGMKSYNIYMNPTVSFDAQACLSFTVPLPPPSLTLFKAAEGSSALVGGKVLFTIYYTAANTSNLAITDVVDPNFIINAVYNGGGAAGQTITWNVPGPFTAPTSGFVSFLATVKAGTPINTVIHNQASGVANSVPTVQSNIADVVVGTVGLSIVKSVAPTTAVSSGNTLTYTMVYSSEGESLAEYANFDSGIPGGWVTDGTGSWSAGTGALVQSTGPGVNYPGIMDSNIQVHDAVYITDMMVSSADTGNYDAVMRINSNQAPVGGGAMFWNIRLSTDTNDINIDRLGTNLASTSSPHGLTLLNDTWYTVKAEVVCGNVRVKVWPRGGTEPPAWDVSTTDATLASAAPGYPGYQANNGPASYDNFKVFSLAGATNPVVWDTVPAGTTYIAGSCGSCTVSGNVLSWNVTQACGNTGSVSFRTTVNAGVCNPITNSAMIDSSDPPPAESSNTVSSTVVGGCPSPTFTLTPSDTPSSSPTRTATPTASATPTSSDTPSPSPTPSSTGTATATSSLTPTRSVTPSATPSVTVSDTQTLGPSATDTATPSATPSITQSSTQTSTFTETPSRTVTPTDTQTSTITPSVTETMQFSPTDTPTFSDTATITPTFTETVTFTGSPTQSDTETVTLTPSASETPSVTPSLTDSPTQSDTYTFTATPSETPSSSSTPTVTDSATTSPTRTVSPTITVSPTVSPTPIPAPHQVRIAVYNSAGELVRLLFNGGAQYEPGQLSLDKSVIPGGAGSLGISFPGYLLDPTGHILSGLTWAADNDSGQLVKGGVYTVKAEITDQFGQVTALQQSVQVVSVQAENSLFIYNSAGERVVQLPLPPVGTGRFDSLSLDKDSFGAHYDSANGTMAQAEQFKIVLKDEQGHDYPIYWDGRNSQGVPVASGSYTAELVYNAPGAGGSRAVETKSFVVLQSGDGVNLDGAFAYPNPALHVKELKVSYKPSAGCSASARLYSLNGELVAQADDLAQSGTLGFNIGSLASGVYVVKLEKLSGAASLARTVLKVAIVR